MRYLFLVLLVFAAPALSKDTSGLADILNRMNKVKIKGSSKSADITRMHSLSPSGRADVDLSYKNRFGVRVKKRVFVQMSPLKSKRFWTGCMMSSPAVCGGRFVVQQAASMALNWILNEVNGELFAGEGSQYSPGSRCSSSKIPITVNEVVKWHWPVACFVKKSSTRWEFWTDTLSPSVREWSDGEQAISEKPADYTTRDGVKSRYGKWWVVTRTVESGTEPEPISERVPVKAEEFPAAIAANPGSLVENGKIPDVWEDVEIGDGGNGEGEDEAGGNNRGYISDISDALDAEDEDLEEEEIDIYDYFLDREGSGWLPKSCPTPTVLNLSFTTLTIDYSMMCQFASYIRTFVLFMSSILWFRIVFGAVKDA